MEVLKPKLGITRALLAASGILGLVFLMLPILVIVPMSFSSASALTFPPPGYSLRWYIAFLTDPRWLDALWTSLTVATLSSIGAVTLGGCAAYGLAQMGSGRGMRWIEGNFAAPLVVPGIISAVALYIAFAKAGILGTYYGLVAAHLVLSTPFVIIVLGEGLKSLDPRIEQVAWTLGASRLQAILRIVIPNVLPSIGAGWIFAFIASFDEVVVTAFIAGTNDTIPKRMFNELAMEINPAITAVSTFLIAITTVGVGVAAIALRKRGSKALGLTVKD